MRWLISGIVLWLPLQGALAQNAPQTQPADALRLPFVLGDNMVLQRDMADPVWGFAKPGDSITIQFADQTKTTTADATGHWSAKLDPMPASAEPRVLTIADGAQTIALNNILVGEVWLCSGQSNMEKPIGLQKGQKPTENWQQEVAGADHPLIRLLGVPTKLSNTAASPIKWNVCTPQSIAKIHFSAAGYFFGRKIQQEINVPVGLINSSWGGTRIEPWTNAEGFDMVPSLGLFANAVAHRQPTTRLEGPQAGELYQAMIAPIVPFGMRGAIWYQGETNVMYHDRLAYVDKMKALIGGWRKVWDEGDFPFYYVELAPFTYTALPKYNVQADDLPSVWEAQREAMAIPNTGMAETTDLVSDVNDIHPTRKREVGERLALWALAHDYGKKDLVCSGPIFQSCQFSDGAARVRFQYADGIKASDGKQLNEFSIAGPDGKFVDATAVIDGEAVSVSNPSVKNPTMVRLGWSELAMPNLVNAAGLPAVPFEYPVPEAAAESK